jgi:hypothetical protein
VNNLRKDNARLNLLNGHGKLSYHDSSMTWKQVYLTLHYVFSIYTYVEI